MSFLEPDHWLAPEFCERLRSPLDADDNQAMAYCDLQHCVTWAAGPGEPHLQDDLIPRLLIAQTLSQYAVVMKRSALDRVGLFDPDLGERADWDLWLRIAAAGHGVTHVEGKLAYYRWHAGSRRLRQMPASSAEALRKLLRLGDDAHSNPVSDVDRHGGANAPPDAEELERARARIAWLEETKASFERSARSWQNEAERLRDVGIRFENYFRETQAWMASLEEAKRWHEEQAEHWRREAERRG